LESADRRESFKSCLGIGSRNVFGVSCPENDSVWHLGYPYQLRIMLTAYGRNGQQQITRRNLAVRDERLNRFLA
jgi:hypothetical protein